MQTSPSTVALLGIFLSFAVFGEILAQQEEVVSALKRRTEGFFQNLVNVGPKKAFNDLLVEGPLAGRDAEIKQLIDKVQRFEQTYGKLVEVEVIGEKRVGRDLVLLKYLYKMPRFPLVWYITYYRSPSDTTVENNWDVIEVRFDNRLYLLGL